MSVWARDRELDQGSIRWGSDGPPKLDGSCRKACTTNRARLGVVITGGAQVAATVCTGAVQGAGLLAGGTLNDGQMGIFPRESALLVLVSHGHLSLS